MKILFNDFNHLSDLVPIYLRGFLIQNIRYFIFAGLAFSIIFIWKKSKWNHRKIWQRPISKLQIRREIRWSLLTCVLLGFIYLGVAWFTKLGWTKVYLSISERGWGYLLLSTALMVIWHDTWFYWIHRLLHWKPLMKKVHRVHHLSSDPSPFAAFSFHPLETILEAGFAIIAVFVLPIHPITLLLVNFFQMSMNVMGHSGHELLPKWFIRHPLFKWFNTSTHHHMHHRFNHHNFGLYFNIWDRLLKTNHPRYFDTFDEVQSRTKS